MSFVIASQSRFPAGTSVAAHPRSHWPTVPAQPSGAPSGSATESATVASDRSLTFSSLAAGTTYFLYASVSSKDVIVQVNTGGLSSSTSQFQGGATDGQVPVWDAAAGAWVPGDAASGGAASYSAGVRASRPSAGSVASGYVYYATDNGISYQSDGASTWTAVAWSALRVTALPSSPAPEDQQQILYVASATDGILWPFVYNAGSASSYKWEGGGGAPLTAEAGAADETTVSTSYAALSTAGPSITVPLAGDYDIEVSCITQNSLAAGATYMGYDIGGTGAVDADAAYSLQGLAGTAWTAVARRRRKTALAASTALVSKYRVTSGTGGWRGGTNFKRIMRVWPVRVG